MRGRIAAQLVLAVLATGCGAAAPREYTAPDGRYRVIFPETPDYKEETVATPNGPIHSKSASRKDRSGTERVVITMDFPGHFVDRAAGQHKLDSVCDSWASDNNVTITGNVQKPVNGHPGRELTFETQAGHPAGKLTGRGRFFFVGSRFYEVYIAVPPGRATTEVIDAFLDSFVLLDQPAGPMDVQVAGGPLGPNPRPRRPRVPKRSARATAAPDAAPASAARQTLALYNIPEPASAAIEADIPGMASTPPDRPPAEPAGLGGSSPSASAQGASIKAFRWLDEDDDQIAGAGAEPKPDGTRDQHLRLELNLPPNTIIQLMSITSGADRRWGTQPGEKHGPIGIFRRGRPVARTYVAQVGLSSGPQEFDLYLNTEAGVGPGASFDLEVVLAIGGGQVMLTSHCHRPDRAPAPLADARPSHPSGAAAGPTTPEPQPEPAAEPPRRSELRPRSGPATAARKAPADFVPAIPVPAFVTASSGGATILSFDWIDRNDDYVGTDVRRVGPGGGKDEHYRLVMDLPPAAIIEEITISGGAVVWTTKPLARSWPIAVVANQSVKNRGQAIRLGTFSGRWAFDLYAESHETDHPGQAFGIEVVVYVRGTKHRLSARCQGK